MKLFESTRRTPERSWREEVSSRQNQRCRSAYNSTKPVNRFGRNKVRVASQARQLVVDYFRPVVFAASGPKI